MSWSRRTFLKAGLAAGSVAALSFELPSDSLSNYPPVVEKKSVILSRLPPAFDGFRIAFIADLHFGMWMPHEWIEKTLELVNQAQPDLLVLGGDYIMIPDFQLFEQIGTSRNPLFNSGLGRALPAVIFSELSKLLEPYTKKIKTVAVLGNHDRWLAPEISERTLMTTPGITVLNNSFLKLERDSSALWLIGTDDYLTGIPRLVDPPKDEAVRILITHNPDLASRALDLGYPFELALSGHTHGGQVRPTLTGALAYNISDKRFAEGLVSVGETYVYTTRGIGFVAVPFRLNCPPEVTVIDLYRT